MTYSRPFSQSVVKDSKDKKKEVQKAQHHRRPRRRGKRLIQIGKISVSIIKGSILEQTVGVKL